MTQTLSQHRGLEGEDSGRTLETQPLVYGPNGPPKKGPVRILCDEIGFPWDPRLERTDVFVAFVRELADEIDHQQDVLRHIDSLAVGRRASPVGKVAMEAARQMLSHTRPALLRNAAGRLHDMCDELNPESAYPTDHFIDMLSSLASAIRFGLDDSLSPLNSRHAAHAAQHVWKQVYGVTLFDSHTPAWENDWARAKLTSALVSLLPPGGVGRAPRPHTASMKRNGGPLNPISTLNDSGGVDEGKGTV